MSTILLPLLVLLVAPFQSPAGDPPDRAAPANVVVIMADDLGLCELGCTGSGRIRTPHIDRLRERGMLFTRAYSGSTVCAPSRCTLLTGLHTGHAQVRDNLEQPNHSGPPDAADTVRIGAWKAPPSPGGRWGGQLALEADTETIAVNAVAWRISTGAGTARPRTVWPIVSPDTRRLLCLVVRPASSWVSGVHSRPSRPRDCHGSRARTRRHRVLAVTASRP